MKKCIKLALKGEGKTSPNPLVGCVVLDKTGKIISTGYHKAYGKAHAEADALNKLTNEAQGGTLIVNLEPCSHWGKTPPCADLIIEKGIKTLVIGMKDPNPKVEGNGALKCKKAGIEVIEDVLLDEVKKLNEVFIKNMSGKTFVAIKTATTLDGKIATKTGSSKWITSQSARDEVQRIRYRYDAILTTSTTVICDNPSMTCRGINGKGIKKLTKIILDRELKTDFDSKIYEKTGEKIYIVVAEGIFSEKIKTIPAHIGVIKCPIYNSKLDLEYLFRKLFELNIYSVLVEAGGKLNGELISNGLADKIYHFIAPKIIADKNAKNAFEGCDITEVSSAFNYEIENTADFKPDILITYIP